MICKKLVVDFKSDLRRWVFLFVSLIFVVAISMFDGYSIEESIASVWFLVMFMSAVVTISDVMHQVISRRDVDPDPYWIIFAIIFVVLSALYNYIFGLSLAQIVGLFIAAAIFAAALVTVIFINTKHKRGRPKQ